MNLIALLRGTPWWVHIIWAYVLYTGIQATKTRSIPPWKLFIFPSFFGIWFLASLIKNPIFYSYHPLLCLLVAITGSALGMLIAYHRSVQRDSATDHLQLGGTWNMLIVLVIIFIAKYFFGYMCATATPDMCTLYRMHSTLFSLGTTSLFWTHTLVLWHRWRHV